MSKKKGFGFIAGLILILSFICFAGNVAMAETVQVYTDGEWIRSQKGRWWYRYEDGTYPVNKWLTINKKWYYFDSNGWMKTGWIKDGNNWYYLNSNGSMRTGWVKYKNEWYYCRKNGAMKTGWLYAGEKWYFLNSDGVMQTGWVKVRGEWYYMYEDGSLQLGPIDKRKADENLVELDRKLTAEGFEREGDPQVIEHWMNWMGIKEMFEQPVYGAYYHKTILNEAHGYGGEVIYRIYRLDTGEVYREIACDLK